jgi:hypothetical protein
MAAPAPRRAPVHEHVDEPPIDSRSYQRALRHARARRRARIEHRRELKRARVRFLVLVGALLFFALFVSLSIWEKIEALFGL